MTDGVVDTLIAQLQAAWNAGNGTVFAQSFAEDATMIDVRGRLLTGRAVIAQEHQSLFDTVYQGSSLEMQLVASRPLPGGVILAHTTSIVRAPTGPRAGENHGVQTQLIENGRILAFQNTIHSA